MVYVRLSKFDKSENECKSDIDQLLFTLKNAHKVARRPKNFNKAAFKHLFDIAQISNFSDEELMNYESDMKSFSDHANALAYAKEKGEAIGEAKGLKRGRSEIARNMLGEGMEPALVARYTKLPLKAVKALR
jgi:predicted transposase/invertase (TIGR01784 family)